jgi:hypothetical protein
MKSQIKRSIYDDMNCTYQGRELKFPPKICVIGGTRAERQKTYDFMVWLRISGLKEKITGQVVLRYVCEIFLAKKLKTIVIIRAVITELST